MDINSNKSRSVLICLILALVTIAVFYQAGSFKFINLDDPEYIYKNPNIQNGITPAAIKWAFITGYASNWHPLTWLSHMLDWQLFGADPAGHHIVNLIFHIANTLLVFLVLGKMTSSFWQSAFVAALFALHPLHVESVAWAAERKDVLSTFFWLFTMWAYVRYCHRTLTPTTGVGAKRYYLLTIVFFALGLLAKPMLVTLPFVLLLLDYWPLNRLWPAIGAKRKKGDTKFSPAYLFIEKIPLFAMALASSVITFIVQKKGGAMYEGQDYGFFVRLTNVPVSYMQYIIKLFWPARLAFFYPHPGPNISVPFVVMSIVLILGVTIAVIRFAPQHRYLVTGWFWYLGTLVPVIGLVQVGDQAIADRYTYITLTGLFIIIVWGVPELLENRPYRKITLQVSAFAVLSALAVCTYLQLGYWKNSLTLCEHALAVNKDNYLAHFNMTEMLIKEGRVQEAIQHNFEAVRIKPNYAKAINNLGVVLYGEGKIDEAIGYFQNAIKINPRTAEAHANLGVIFANKGEFAEAVKHYEDALLIQPQNAAVHNGLGMVFFQQGKIDQAIAHFKQALQINPQYTDAQNNFNIALTEKQKSRQKP